MTCAQIAIIPKNKVSEASVAASSTTARTMTRPHKAEQEENIVHGMFQVKRLVVRSKGAQNAGYARVGWTIDDALEKTPTIADSGPVPARIMRPLLGLRSRPSPA
jgi:hypothetical protein